MKRRVACKSCAEEDALTRAKRYFHWRPGTRAAVKRLFNKRERRALNALEIEEMEMDEHAE